MSARIIFAGTPEFAVPSLAALINQRLQIVAVYTQPDRPAGRGQKLQMSPVKRLALDHALPVFQPESLKKEAGAVAELCALKADLMIVVAYGLLLPVAVLEAPRLGCVNVHASLLPRWRGAAPIQRAVLAGDSHSGVCIMGMEAGLDTGPVYHRVETPIAPHETGGTLHDRLATLGAQALCTALPGIFDSSTVPQPQDDALATYARKLTKEEALIDWSLPADTIERQIRAFNPWPVAYTHLDGAVLRIWDAEADLQTLASSTPGTVMTTGRTAITVATGQGTLRITRLQPSGKKLMTAGDYLNARHLQGAQLA